MYTKTNKTEIELVHALISNLGTAKEWAELLGFASESGFRNVQFWVSKTRPIPEKYHLLICDSAEIFLNKIFELDGRLRQWRLRKIKAQ